MTRTKDPAAHGAPARRAAVQGEKPGQPGRLSLSLLPRLEGLHDLADASGAAEEARAECEDGGLPESNAAPKEKRLGRPRTKSPISAVAINRVISAVKKAGLPVATVEVRSDGSLVIGTITSDDKDDFERWSAVL